MPKKTSTPPRPAKAKKTATAQRAAKAPTVKSTLALDKPQVRMLLRGLHQQVKVYIIKPELEAEFLAFCEQGARDATGAVKLDENGEPMTGVRQWLLDQGVTCADFWVMKTAANTGEDSLFMLIVALDVATERPWYEIPGFTDFLATEYGDMEQATLRELRIAQPAA